MGLKTSIKHLLKCLNKLYVFICIKKYDKGINKHFKMYKYTNVNINSKI